MVVELQARRLPTCGDQNWYFNPNQMFLFVPTLEVQHCDKRKVQIEPKETVLFCSERLMFE